MTPDPTAPSARRRALRGVGWLVFGLLILVGARGLLLVADDASAGTPEWNQPTTASLRFLSDDLETHADAMQALFPEGRLFTLALTGMAWAELWGRGGPYPEGAPEAVREAHALALAPETRAAFGPAGGLPHGMFYEAWTAHLAAAVLQTSTPDATVQMAQFDRLRASCGRIARAFEADVFPDSYPGQAWPADAAVGAAVLADCGPPYDDAAAAWLVEARAREDPATGLLPHADGASAARGSSSALMIPFVAQIDSAYAATLYERFQAAFATRMLGVLPAMREYPRGTSGRGDIDSGPVVLGASAPASVVGIAAAMTVGDRETAEGLRASTDAFGVPMTRRGRRRYAAGRLPVGDAFLAWASSRPAVSSADPDTTARPWRLRWAGSFAALLALGIVGLYRSTRSPRPKRPPTGPVAAEVPGRGV